MKVKMKLEVEMNEADYLAVVAITGKRRLSISGTINVLVSDALKKVDPRELFTNDHADKF